MSIVLYFQQAPGPRVGKDERIDRLFSGQRSHWRQTYNHLFEKVQRFGSDVAVSPTDTYVSLLRKGRKFSIVQVTSDRMDIGIKLKDTPAQGRFQKAGTWNAMVTHRVRVEDPRELDAEVMSWLKRAYERA